MWAPGGWCHLGRGASSDFGRRMSRSCERPHPRSQQRRGDVPPVLARGPGGSVGSSAPRTTRGFVRHQPVTADEVVNCMGMGSNRALCARQRLSRPGRRRLAPRSVAAVAAGALLVTLGVASTSVAAAAAPDSTAGPAAPAVGNPAALVNPFIGTGRPRWCRRPGRACRRSGWRHPERPCRLRRSFR